ncbi:hypothetical protein N9148_00485 [bacterium]|nr:hypothetical protein [bacterium]
MQSGSSPLLKRQMSDPIAMISSSLSALDGLHGMVTVGQFLGHVYALAEQLPNSRFTINLCENRYLFMVGFMDQYQTPCLHNFNNQLMRADGTQTMPQLKENIHSLEIISAAVLDMLGSDRIAHRNSAEADLLGDYRALIQS